jgi:hypothetical protein
MLVIPTNHESLNSTFVDSFMSLQVARAFVEALSHGANSFTKIDLFDNSYRGCKWDGIWHIPKEDDYTRSWKETINGEINKLTWSNRFEVNKENFLHQLLGPGSVEKKLDFCSHLCGYSRIDNDKSLSDDDKLCLRAMEAANKYDNRHKLMSDAPSMLYSLIREIPEFFSQFIVDDGADQRMKKGKECKQLINFM